MEMFHTSLKPLLFHDNSKPNEVCDFELSVSVESLIDHLKGDKPPPVLIHGEPGCGRTTLLLGICDTLLERNWLKKSEILGMRVRHGCTMLSLWSFLSEIAKDKLDKDILSLLLQPSAKLNKKQEVAQELIASNFKLICVDDAFADGGRVWSHLSQLFSNLNACVIAACSQSEAALLQATMTQQNLIPVSVKLKGIHKEPFKKLLLQQLPNNFTLHKLFDIYSVFNGNPTSLKLFLGAVNEFKLSQQSVNCSFLASSTHSEELPVAEHTVLHVLQFVFQLLTPDEKNVFYQLCLLREPLPLVTVPQEIEKLARLGLVEKEVISEDKEINSVLYTVSVPSCFCLSSWQFSCIADKNGPSKPDLIQECFSVFDLWFSLLSEKLFQLISDAQGNAWPFVPEKWQYISNVGEEERYNIKELITAKNSVVPYMSEQDILEECLYQAAVEKKYGTMAALVFVMDRFSYWQGSSHTTLQLVDFLKTNSPTTPIAPQLLIRKARVMKNAGDLHGAEKALDELLIKKSQVGEWIYKYEHDHQLVSAVCIQIKGDIQYNLGQWVQGAKLLLESLILFSTLPIPDTKGIASSLAILANCLEPMSMQEYVPIAQSYGLTGSHPLLQAYYCSYEASMRSQYTPLFYARHKCRAAEFMLCYSQLIPDEIQRIEHLKIAAEDFKDSIQAHKEVNSLTSREEFYVFVCAVYKLGITYQARATQDSIQQAHCIDEMSRLLYEHYCSFTGTILLDKEITDLITYCLSYLQLNQFCGDELPNTKSLVQKFEHIGKTGVTGEEDIKKAHSLLLESSDPLEVQISEEFVFADNETVLKVRLAGHTVSDKLKDTWEQKTDSHDITSVVLDIILMRSDKSSSNISALTVDRNCDTKNSKSAVVIDTVDRSIVTQCLEQETVSFPSKRFLAPETATIQSQFQGLTLNSSPRRVQGAIVWRYDSSCNIWRGEKTLAYVGNLLELAKDKEGAQRNAFMVEFINQEDPFAKYVAKCYKKAKDVQQYQQDVICQMTARYYATLFNRQLNKADLTVGHIEFLPVVLLQLVNPNGSLSGVYNVERYMAGEFIKLTNNFQFAIDRGVVSDLVLAFSHFTHQASNGQLIIVDIQGWTPASNEIGCTFLTDPQIHSVVYNCFGTGNLSQKGIDSFWKKMHPQCNDLCKQMQLFRPDAHK